MLNFDGCLLRKAHARARARAVDAVSGHLDGLHGETPLAAGSFRQRRLRDAAAAQQLEGPRRRLFDSLTGINDSPASFVEERLFELQGCVTNLRRQSSTSSVSFTAPNP